MINVGLKGSFVADASISFKKVCIGLLDVVYAEVYTSGKITRDFDENAVTEVLVARMNHHPYAMERHITAETEKRLLPEGFKDPIFSVNNVYRIDIMIGGFGWSKEEYRISCYMEAKNLYSKSFTKLNNKNPTSPSKYAQRYIKTGIDHILNGNYPSDTLLLGYVLVGTVHDVVEMINKQLINASRNSETIHFRSAIGISNLELGVSKHSQGVMIEHCFLLF